ncbi:hypothetical protein BBP40_012149 [Aspergillus hancockii]|nr:hypothetical protein BBP40_012149 [Aspergillus hancockii]
MSPRKFQPLELSFEAPGNQMPGLPEFEDFQIEEESPVLARPLRTLRTSVELPRLSRSKTHRPSSSFQLVRKPVGSGSRRSSLATLEQLMEKQIPNSNPLIPHFSNRSPAGTGLTRGQQDPTHNGLDSTNGCGSVLSKPEHSKGLQASKATIPPRTPTNNTSINLQDRSLPSIPLESSPSSSTTQRPPTTPTEIRPPTTASENRYLNPASTTTPTRSGRVTQWLFQGNKASSSPSRSPWKPTISDKIPFRIHSRTLSGSTLTSTLTNLTSAFKPTASISSNTTAATPIPSSSHLDSRLDKDLNIPMSFSRPYLPKQADEPTTYSTVLEGQQHQNQQHGLDEFGHNCYTTYRRSAVGLAF